jgi:spore cortex formation protein SpoVR/YcgB (stage V sporulation)
MKSEINKYEQHNTFFNNRQIRTTWRETEATVNYLIV